MEIVYLRAGDLPEGNKSINHRTKVHEAGVSVWEALRMEDGTYRLLMPAVKRTQWEAAATDIHWSYGKPFYLITGKVLKERGSVGEPLLKDPVLGEQVKVVVGRPWIVHPYKGKLSSEEMAQLKERYDELYGPEEDADRTEVDVASGGEECDEAEMAVAPAVVDSIRALITKDFLGDQQIDRIRQMVTQELFDEYRGVIGGPDAMNIEFPRRFAEAITLAIQNKLAELAEPA
jgi:hypothetical protein